MIRLTPVDWQGVKHLVDEQVPFVNVTMGFQRRSSGEIWVDNRDDPSTLLAIFGCDAWAWGNLGRPSIRQLLACFSGTIADSDGLEPILADVWSDYIRIPSVVYRHVRMPSVPSVPEGFRLTAISPDNVALIGRLWPDDACHGTVGYFDDHADFFRSGYGYMVIDEKTKQCVSLCAAIAVTDERVDHGLDTVYAYEGLGLGTACAAATVREGVRRGLQPVWMAAVGNEASHKVAMKVGFAPNYELLLFERL